MNNTFNPYEDLKYYLETKHSKLWKHLYNTEIKNTYPILFNYFNLSVKGHEKIIDTIKNIERKTGDIIINWENR
uniref:Uncharacterized protein n=1 Tax=viral metagenome TaxID=1070528 RepID=A0A6H1ZVY8_9ZZZZ